MGIDVREMLSEEYENELSLVGDLSLLGVPATMSKLSFEGFSVLSYMVDSDSVCEYTGRKTLNNILESYIEANSGDKYVRELVNRVWEKHYETDENGKMVMKGYRRKEGSNNHYLLLRAKAAKFWADNGLQAHMEVAKEFFNYGGITRVERLKDATYDDALYHEDPQIRARNRAMVMKFEGLDKNKGNVVVNLFDKHGGRELTEHISELSGDKLYDVSTIIDADIEE